MYSDGRFSLVESISIRRNTISHPLHPLFGQHPFCTVNCVDIVAILLFALVSLHKLVQKVSSILWSLGYNYVGKLTEKFLFARKKRIASAV